MASYHLSVKIISRGAGRSGIAAAAYRSCSKIYDERQGISFDYSKKKHLGHSEILLPEGAPAWMKDRNILWNTVEATEKRKDAQICREIEIALPSELLLEDQIELTREFCQDNFVSQGMVADLNIHAEVKNPHAHIMLTMREILPGGFGKKVRNWNGKDNILKWREAWANIQNIHLAKAGYDIHVDHRSYADLGINIEPQIKLGVAGYADKKTELERTEEYNRITFENGARIIKDPEIALDYLSYHHAVFKREDIYKFALSHSFDRKQYDQVVSAIFKSRQLVNLGRAEDGKERFTTRTLLKAENEMLTAAEKMAQRKRHPVSKKFVKQASVTRSMTAEQEKAYRYILDGCQVVAVVGYAGTGKSYTLAAVRNAYEAQGYYVRGMTLTGIAAENLQIDSGIQSTTIHRALLEWENGRNLPGPKSILVVDEAGMIGTRQMHQITAKAKKTGAKVILVGDFDQLQPIEAGGSFRGICEKIGHYELTDIRRQETDWQKDATKLLSGTPENVAQAIDLYDREGHIKKADTLDVAKENLISDWQKAIEEESSKIILAYRNKDVKELNQSARHHMIEAGLLKEAGYKFDTVKGAAQFQSGERIIFLKNENSLGVKNGSLGTVEDINDKSMMVRLDNGKRVAFDPKRYNHFYYGYAATVHKTQGVTVDKAFVLGTKHFDKHSAYVVLSRHRKDVRLYVSGDKDGFKNYGHMKYLMSRKRPKSLIKEYAQVRGVKVDLRKIYTRHYYDIEIQSPELHREFKQRVSVDGKFSHEESKKFAGQTARDLAAKLCVSKKIKDTKNLVVKVRNIDVVELRQMDQQISKHIEKGRQR
jgi:Ti-type conjugative transfer relaxase TraA